MAYSFQVTFDCREPHVLADWWADALGWEVETQDAEFIRSMIDQGFATEAETSTHKGKLVWKEGAAIFHPDDAPGPERRRIYFQSVSEPKTVKNRVHLDLRVGHDRIEAEVERLKA
ncbi:MAG TPA: VOC family protein, partial [Acidimicrobiales bacterium]